MKRIFILLLCLGLVGCATNPYQQFYTDLTHGVDVTTQAQFEISPDVPKIYSGNNIDEDAQRMMEDGYAALGYSSFNGADINQNAVIDVGKKVHAAVILVYSKYINTLSGLMPLVLPDNKTITTNSSGTANYTGTGSFSGMNSGTGDRYSGTSNMQGTASAHGQSTTMVSGTKTMYVPYNINRYDYYAAFWIKVKPPILGILLRDLNSDERKKIGTNKGIFVMVVRKDSPAYKADLFKGDIIIKINDNDVLDMESFDTELDVAYATQGKKIVLELIRDGKNLTKEVQLAQKSLQELFGGNIVHDEKCGEISDSFYLYLSKISGLNKTAKADRGKVYESYHEKLQANKDLEKKYNSGKYSAAEMYKIRAAKLKKILLEIKKVEAEYAEMNQLRALFDERMPNCQETEDVTDAIISILNSK